MSDLKLNYYEPNEVVKGNKYNSDLKEIEGAIDTILSFTGIGDISFKKDYLAMVTSPFVDVSFYFTTLSFIVKFDSYKNIQQPDNTSFSIINNSLNFQTFELVGKTPTEAYFNKDNALIVRIYDATNDTTLVEIGEDFSENGVRIDNNGNFKVSIDNLLFNNNTTFNVDIKINSLLLTEEPMVIDTERTYFHISGSELSNFSIKTSNIEYDGDTAPETNLNKELTTIQENIDNVIKFRGKIYAFSKSSITPPFAYGTWEYIGEVPDGGTILGGGDEGTISNGSLIDHNHEVFSDINYGTGGGASSGGYAGISALYGFGSDGRDKTFFFGGGSTDNTGSFYTGAPLPGTDDLNKWPVAQTPTEKNKPYGITLGTIYIWKRVS